MSLYTEMTTGPLATEIAPYLANGNHYQIAQILSRDRKKIVETRGGNLAVLATIGIASGNTLLDAIHGDTRFRHVKPALDNGTLDISNVLVRATLDSFVPAVITQAEADAIKNLAQVDDIISVSDVSRAIALGV